MTNYKDLTIERVLYLHERIINQAKGIQGVRDFTLMHSALERCKVTFAGKDLYQSIFDKAAALIHSMIMNHPFLDGNKRTAYAIVKRFLYTNGYKLRASNSQIIKFCVAVDNEKLELTDIITWFEEQTEEL